MQLNHEIYEKGLVKVACDAGGIIKPLQFKLPPSDGVAMMNPSILNLNGQLLVNLRCTNYTLYHNEDHRLPHYYGYLSYIHPSDQRKLITTNYIAKLDNNLNLYEPTKVNMLLDVKPKWDFWGLEDARLINWDNNLFLCGVRRDTTDNGEGRMELTQLDYQYNEIARLRIPMPNNQQSYCEKNWVPILDQPYKFIKWSNPVEIVSFDVNSRTSTSEEKPLVKEFIKGIRGGTQVIPYKDYYIAIGHSFCFETPKYGSKDGSYLANLIVWDKELNLKYISKGFKFLNSKIEFQCGICQYDEKLLITFSCTDNVAYVVSIKPEVLFNLEED